MHIEHNATWQQILDKAKKEEETSKRAHDQQAQG